MQLSLTLDASNHDEIRAAIRLLQDLVGVDPYDAVLRADRAPVVETPPAAEVFTPDPAQVFAGNAQPPAATPAPIAPAPAGTPPAPAPAPVVSAPAGVDLDAKGLPWDMRIHASTKVKNADGSWRAKRGLNDGTLVARVEAELRGAMSAPPAPPPAPAAPAVAAAPSFPGDAAANPVPPVPSVPSVAAPVPPAASTGVTTFPDIMRKISGLLAGATPRLTHPELQEALTSVGIASLPLLASRPDLIPQVDAVIDAMLVTKPAAPAAPLPPGTPLH